ncbi:fibulin-2 [Pangasianodon hypophthalmus]|uniref:fibulin-2 n=1 Tax=Pangasianodon hypophthalmus TaxID=310915 RepID=UPI0023078DBC|nr:fibulin-2 [Pangasianodon hypophthalmus]
MNERVWVKWTVIPCALVLLHTCLGQKDCTGVDCPLLDDCIEEVLESGACCATCLRRGCTCEGYQYYDCISAGFKNGKVPERESYLVDSGSTECWCPAGGGRISCRFIPCPDVPPHCIELSDSTEACPHCLRIGCVYENQTYEAGHSFHMDLCQVCHCPNNGGDLMCSVIPDCSLEKVKKPEVKENELHISKHENPGDLPSEDNTFLSNSVPIYTGNTSEFEESEDYDYFHEVTASPDVSIPSSAAPQAQIPHDVLHEDTREELRETLGTYDAESREEGTEDSLNVTTVKPDSYESSEKFSSQTETVVRYTQVPPRETTPNTIDDVRRTEKSPEDHRNLQHTIPEHNTVPKLQFISTTSPPVSTREPEAHSQPETQGRYHQERNDLHLTSENQRVTSREVSVCCVAGENWASAHGHCNSMVPMRTEPGSTCWSVQRQCCLNALRESRCSSGINTARRGRDCGADDVDLCDSHMECCKCCALGLRLRAQRESCDPPRGLGETCSHALLTCCEGTGTTNHSAARERTHPRATSPLRRVPEGPERQAFSLEEVEDTENMVETVEGLEDVDECSVYAGQLCHHQCVNTQGSYVCVCFPGFVLQPDGIHCMQQVMDDDERGLKEDDVLAASWRPAETTTMPPPDLPDPCEGNGHCAQHCHPVEGRAHCSCFPGFSLMPDGRSCEDINECTLGAHSCGPGFDCINTAGSFSCRARPRCPGGFTQDSRGQCVDIDECRTVAQPCSPGFNCINTIGSYTCQRKIILCGRGYHSSPDGTRCIDIDECESGVHRCGEGQICHNLPGTYRCDCHPGYQYDTYRRTCVDVNECWRYSGRLCAQTCENTPGSYRCSCTAGFTLSSDGKSCEDVNECLNSPCSHECVNVYGSYQCYCRQGYYLREDAHTCEDIDECAQSVGHLCAYKCVNVPGSYDCACPEHGYSMAPNRRSCHDIDECAVGAHNCTAGETCYNIHGGFRCLSFSCPANYRRAADTRCERISCSNFVECQNSPVRITYYQLSFQTNIIVPALIFRMGPSPAYTGDNIIISIIRGNEDGYFSPRKLNAYTGAIYLQRQLPQPRDFLLDVEMKLWRQGTFTTFLARIYIFITANVV